MKNCGYKFHVLVTTRDFIEGVLVRSIIPRNDPPLVLHDRVLSIIQVRFWVRWLRLDLLPANAWLPSRPGPTRSAAHRT